MNQGLHAVATDNILAILCLTRRKLMDDMACQHKSDRDCVRPHIEKINALVAAGKPIRLVLPAFPAKSPNGNKTRGALPDLGERMALNALERMCVAIEACYLPGAEVVICSDGRVFNDLVKVRDKDVDAYSAAIRNIIKDDKLRHLSTFSLEDYCGAGSYTDMRCELVNAFADPIEIVKANVKTLHPSKALFNGIHRFIYEDYLSLLSAISSKNKIRVMTKEVAYRVIQRSNAWGRLVSLHYPDAVRLSIHPQPCGSDKLGIMLLKSEDMWATPWHRVVLVDGKEHVLVKNKDAKAMGAAPVFINNQFSHYEKRYEH